MRHSTDKELAQNKKRLVPEWSEGFIYLGSPQKNAEEKKIVAALSRGNHPRDADAFPLREQGNPLSAKTQSGITDVDLA